MTKMIVFIKKKILNTHTLNNVENL